MKTPLLSAVNNNNSNNNNNDINKENNRNINNSNDNNQLNQGCFNILFKSCSELNKAPDLKNELFLQNFIYFINHISFPIHFKEAEQSFVIAISSQEKEFKFIQAFMQNFKMINFELNKWYCHNYYRQIFENYDNKNKKIIYEGEFKKGKRNGKGKLIFDDENIYEGSFNNDNFDGDGCFKWKDGREYKGQWKDNNMNGKGIFKWDTNNWYEGDYKNNRREGYGVYHFGEDNYFDGKWLNNLPHGIGKLKINGEKVEGLFRFGKMIKNNKKGNTFIGNIANIDFKDENIGAKAFKRKINSLK
jgi:hypothetical protein